MATSPGRQAALDASPATDLGVRLAVLLAELGPQGAAAVLARLKFPKAVQRRVALLVAEADAWQAPGGAAGGPTDAALRRCLARAGREEALALAALWRAQAAGEGDGAAATSAAAEAGRRLEAQAASAPPLAARDLALSGAEIMARLGLAPGPEVGRVVTWLVERVLDNPGRNTEAGLGGLLASWQADQGGA